MIHDKRKSDLPPKVKDSEPKEKSPSKELVGLGFDEQEAKLKPKDEKPTVEQHPSDKSGLQESPQIDTEGLDKKTKVDSTGPEVEGEKGTKGSQLDEQPEKGEQPKKGKDAPEDKSVDKVVDKALSMEGTLAHRQNAGGASEALKGENKGDPTMNCWDAVLYIVAQAGELKAEVIHETVKRSAESYEAFTSDVQPKLVEEENKLNKDFKQIQDDIDVATNEIKQLEKDVKALKTTFSKYFGWTGKARKKELTSVNERLKKLGERIKTLNLHASQNMQQRKVVSDKRVKGELEAKNRPYKDLLKVDSAEVIMTTTRRGGEGNTPSVTTVEGKWPPPAGYTILLTHDNSKCEDFDHVMLSLGGGRAAHLQSVTPTELGLKGFDAGKLKSVDLLEYMKVAAGTTETWTVKAAPPFWK